MKKILIIHKKQFGYHTDTFELCKYIASDFNITYVCFDSGLPKFDSSNIDVKYINREGSILKRAFRFLHQTIFFVRKEFDVIFLDYFLGCCMLNLFSKNDIVLDFRTGSVDKNNAKRYIGDRLRIAEAMCFRHVTVISEGLKNKLKIANNKSFILPLGANILSLENKKFDYPRLFYIGTLCNRNIHETIQGVSLFLRKYPEYKSILKYDIIGSGNEGEVLRLKKLIEELDLNLNVILHGRKTHIEAQSLFDKCNIGVSYIPITPYYDYQPPTKTFEYILSGMVCIATSTKENEKYICKKNGLLHSDNPLSFSDALEKVVKDFSSYSSESIRKSLENNTWGKIANDFKDYLNNGI